MEQQQQAVPSHSANGKFRNDGSLESVQALMIKEATRFFGRVARQGLPMDFEDCLSECKLAYVKARRLWTPEKARFNTYLTIVIRNEFNRRIERMALDREHLGMGSIDDLGSDVRLDDEVGDGYDRYMNESSSDDDPQARMERQELIRERLGQLSPAARKLVALLLKAEMTKEQVADDSQATLRLLARHCGLAGNMLVSVQQELLNVFGVLVPFGMRKKRAMA